MFLKHYFWIWNVSQPSITNIVGNCICCCLKVLLPPVHWKWFQVETFLLFYLMIWDGCGISHNLRWQWYISLFEMAVDALANVGCALRPLGFLRDLFCQFCRTGALLRWIYKLNINFYTPPTTLLTECYIYLRLTFNRPFLKTSGPTSASDHT